MVGVGFGLDVLEDLGTSANTSATFGVATLASLSILCAGSPTTCCVLITSRGVDITLSISVREVSSKFTNAGVFLRASKNSGSIGV